MSTNIIWLCLSSFVFLLANNQVNATPPLTDKLIFQEKSYTIGMVGEYWLPVPNSKKRQEIAMKQSCTAIGGPVGKWKIHDKKLWLTGFYTCSEDIALNKIYDDVSSPMLASWLTGKIIAIPSSSCQRNTLGKPTHQIRFTFEIMQGKVISMHQEEESCSE